jgi:hypothetical protein
VEEEYDMGMDYSYDDLLGYRKAAIVDNKEGYQ